MKNSESPAMPIIDDEISTHEKEIHFGLTKREMFAMHAMQAMLTSRHVSDFNDSNADFNNCLCSKAVAYADSLLVELEK